jgi:hypothetical protein
MAQHTFDVAAFRAMFPAFSNVVTYPDATLQLWWTMAVQYVNDYDNCLIAGDTLQLALNLMTAHLAQSSTLIANGQSTPGVVGSAAEGTVSISMVPPPVKNMWQYWLSSTPYGQQLLALLQTIVAGGFTIGGLPETSGFRRVGGVFW